MGKAHATPDDVKRLAALARIKIPEENLERFAAEFDAVLAYVASLDTLSLDAAGPEAGIVRNKLRADDAPRARGEYTKRLVDQFPEKEGNALSVKTIISYE
ncbi:MAG TPA: Asp-tRNA(Asn)/Glu-tRNA(Gln) amidotransferase subunit GatC [Candidatus Paceibacterota bacterium]|nr:Asp-tRNA(Asn)/Glu-tRNA(Gln) amidotransferase subunit GatC [Candidatus Paceibacterota bacterium]